MTQQNSQSNVGSSGGTAESLSTCDTSRPGDDAREIRLQVVMELLRRGTPPDVVPKEAASLVGFITGGYRSDDLRQIVREEVARMGENIYRSVDGIASLIPGEAYRRPGMVCGRCGCEDLMWAPSSSA